MGIKIPGFKFNFFCDIMCLFYIRSDWYICIGIEYSDLIYNSFYWDIFYFKILSTKNCKHEKLKDKTFFKYLYYCLFFLVIYDEDKTFFI